MLSLLIAPLRISLLLHQGVSGQVTSRLKGKTPRLAVKVHAGINVSIPRSVDYYNFDGLERFASAASTSTTRDVTLF